jgi:hypothetical protein
MKRLFLILSGFFLLGASAALADNIEDLTGKDWLAMTQAQKEFFVYTGIGGLERQEVVITRLPAYYIETLDKLIKLEPFYEKEYLENLFVFAVYESEPQSRVKIEKIREEISQRLRA